MGVCPDKQPKALNSLNIGGEVITNESEIANALNSFYANAPSKYTPVRSTDLHDEIAENNKNYDNEKVDGNTLFVLPEISTDSVLKQLRNMSKSKSTRLDGIGANTLKLAAPAIADSITYICNISIKTKSFPEKWKEAKETPIFKKGKTDDCSNYRPSSVLSILSKILEEHVYICLYDLLQDNKLLLDTQFEFGKNHSRQTALITLTEEIYNDIQTGNLFGLLQLHLSKAFDLVNHTLLLEKLKLYHCNDDTICWFQYYFKNRSQRVSVKSTLSQPQTINSEVPQESILGSLLFFININDMPLFIKRINTVLYADDATISASGKRIVDIDNTLSDSGTSASKWCPKNDMIFSLPKCNTLIISSKKQPSTLNVDIDGTIGPNTKFVNNKNTWSSLR